MTHAIWVVMVAAVLGSPPADATRGACTEKTTVEKTALVVFRNHSDSTSVWIQAYRDEVGATPGTVSIVGQAKPPRNRPPTDVPLKQTLLLRLAVGADDQVVLDAKDGNMWYVVCF